MSVSRRGNRQFRVTTQTVYHRTQAIADFSGKDATIATDVYGRPTVTTLPTSTTPSNKVKETVSYSWADRPLTVQYTGQNIGTTQNRTYAGYDAVGRIGSIALAATDNPTRYHTYDTGGRLSSYEDWKDNVQIVGWDFTRDEASLGVPHLGERGGSQCAVAENGWGLDECSHGTDRPCLPD